MVRDVASWGVEIECRGQREWRHDMTLLQNAALRKTLGVVQGSFGRKANGIAAVENVETFARTASGRVLVRTPTTTSTDQVFGIFLGNTSTVFGIGH